MEFVSTPVSYTHLIVDKYYNGLILGCLNPDEAIPKFNDELEKAGINTIINEKQRQLDVWLSKQ